MKLTTIILAVAMMTGAAWAQDSSTVDNQSHGAAGTSAQGQQPKPTPGAPAAAVKPAVIPEAKPVAATKPVSPTAAKPTAPVKAAAKPTSSASNQNNRLERVNVVRNADDVQIEISSREAVTPKVDRLSSPARVVVELPATVMATPQNKIPVGSAGVKGVRIGMDGKTPPTTSVVVDLEQAMGYELQPGPGNKFVLTLHTAQAVAKNPSVKGAAKPSAPAPKLQTAVAKPAVAVPAINPKATPTAAYTPAPKAGNAVAKSTPVKETVKPSAPATKPQTAVAKPVVAVPGTNPKMVAATASRSAPKAGKPVEVAKAAAPKASPMSPKIDGKAAASTKIAAQELPATVSKKAEAAAAPKPEAKKWAMTGKRDPFFSPVVQQNSGSGCSTGKKCLEIGQINVRGVVKSESGFIAVVTNSLNKAYFLHENDPVFNGYVVRITGDSVVFQETMQDKLGKPFTREVVKRIITPAV
jgi:Tfp pilus assembly protein PilP